MKAGMIIGGALALAVIAAGCSGGSAGTTPATQPSGATPGAIAASPTPGQPSQSPGDFVVANLNERLRGQSDRAYQTLAKEQQAFVAQDVYVRCDKAADLGVPDSIKVTDTYASTTDVPGTDLVGVPVQAVTVELRWGARKQALTYHLLAEDGGWRWILNAAAMTAERTGNCPAS